jgi:hypothetical protein
VGVQIFKTLEWERCSFLEWATLNTPISDQNHTFPYSPKFLEAFLNLFVASSHVFCSFIGDSTKGKKKAN